MKPLLIYCTIVALAAACNSFQPLSIEKADLKEESLKLNGYYYRIADNHYNVFFIFRNGAYRGGNWMIPVKFDERNLNLLDEEINEL